GEGDRALQQYGDEAVLVADRVDPVGGELGEGVAGQLPQATAVSGDRDVQLLREPGQPGAMAGDRNLDTGTPENRRRITAELKLPLRHGRIHGTQITAAVRGQRPVVEGHTGGNHLPVFRVQVTGEQVHVGEREDLVPFAPALTARADLALEALGDLASVVQQRGGLHPRPEPRVGGQHSWGADPVCDRTGRVPYSETVLRQQFRPAEPRSAGG